MPRRISKPRSAAPHRGPGLVEELAAELRSERLFGQPMITEERFATGAIRVNVFWDRWDDVPSDERGAQIVDAYRIVEGEEFVNRIGLLSGLTFPEAYEEGLLPYQIVPLVRRGDAVTMEQCQVAMIEAGASTLFEPRPIQLRFESFDQAESCRAYLTERLPGSEPVWTIVQDLGTIAEYSRSSS